MRHAAYLGIESTGSPIGPALSSAPRHHSFNLDRQPVAHGVESVSKPDGAMKVVSRSHQNTASIDNM